ncbi:hypothetical protein A9Q81_23010 [Gammaproteobacteria bacterium 42_54_T18]|nr:hypothetical protein A9Q81_23010 [Gammaproteobacteria bacterium 42_54_T18]
MSLMDLLDVLAQKKIKLWLEGDALRFSAPADVFTSELKASVVGKKSEIIAFLQDAQKAQVDTIPHADRSQSIPLSLTQQRLWILHQLEPESVAYNMPIILKLAGSLNVQFFERALQEVVERHESLRTQIIQSGPAACQEINNSPLLPLAVTDISGLSVSEQSDKLQKEIDLELKTPFQLGVDPLVRVRLLKMVDNTKDQFVLLMSMHHIITDGWSLGIVVQELIACYNTLIKTPSLVETTPNQNELQNRASLPVLDVQYADFSVWQRQRMAGGELTRQLAFWRDYLPRDGFVLNLPTDYERTAKPALEGASVSHIVPHEVLEGFKGLIQTVDATLFMGLLSVFDVILAKYSNQSQINVGTPNAGRNRAEVEGLVGFFISTLVMSTKVKKQDRFIDVLKNVKQGAVDVYSNQEAPFEKIVEELQPERDLSRTPLFQVFFNLLNLPELNASFDGVEIESLLADDVDQVSKFDMTVYAKEVDAGLELDVIYNSGLYTQSRMEMLLQHFEHVLRVVSENANITIDDVQLGVSGEFDIGVVAPDEELVSEYTDVLESIKQSYESSGDSIALQCADESWTYDELKVNANRLASYIAEHVPSGAKVALIASRTANLPVGVIAILNANCSFCLIDASYPVKKVQSYLDVFNADYVLVDSGSCFGLELLNGEMDYKNRHLMLPNKKSDYSVLADVVPEIPFLTRDLAAENVAYYNFTSGTQGEPKLVACNLSPLSHFVTWYRQEFGLQDSDCFSMLSGVSHDPILRDIFTPLSIGATLCIPQQKELLEPGYLSHWIRCNNVSVAHLTPSMGELMVQSWGQEVTELRLVCFGGEKMRFSQAKAFSDFAPRAQLVNVYGATETPQIMAFERIDIEQHMGRSNIIPVGVGIDGVQLLVVNDSLRTVGVSEIGEIVIRTPFLSLGYENDVNLTALKFPLMDSSSPVFGNSSVRAYRTGDLGRYLPDGRVQLIDRCDAQVNIRGFRVEPGEIETTLLGYEKIKAAAVKQVDVNGVSQLVAYTVFADNVVSDADSIKSAVFDWVRNKLPEYMLPQTIVILEAIPLTVNGKADYSSLPVPGKGDRASQYVAPRTSIEEQLALIWEEVLGVTPVGVNDSFFELGGHSLLATLVMSRLNAIYQVSIPLRVLFEKITIAAISTTVEEALSTGTGNAAPEINVVSREHNIPVSFAQNRLWFMQKLDPKSVAFNMPFPLLLKGMLDETALERVFQEIFKRHEVLGANFIEQDGLPYLKFNALQKWKLDKERIDVTGINADEIVQLQKRLANTDASISFDLASDPLVRVRLISFDGVEESVEGSDEEGEGQQQGEHLLLMTLHHVISDGWSMNLFMREFVALYETAKHGLKPALAPLKIQYADYAFWQREWLQGDVLDTQLDYWEKKLTNAPQILRLPTDKARPSIQTFSGSIYSKKLSLNLSREVNAFSQKHELSLFMTLMGTYQILLSRYTKTNDICVGTPIAGRHHGNTENVIGLFLNGLIVRTEFDDNPSVDAFYARVKDTMLDAYAHQDLPIEMLFERLDYERNPTYPTGVQVGFQLQNMNNATSVSGQKNSSKGAALGDDLSVSMLQRENIVAKYDMTWVLEERDGILEVNVEYNSDLFFESTIANMVVHYEHLLSAVISGDYQSVRALPIANEKTIAKDIGLDISVEVDDVLCVEAVYPLTLNQESIHLSTLVNPNTVQNSFGFCTDVPASMDVGIMKQAFVELVAEQGVLRTQLKESTKPYLDAMYQVVYQNKKANVEFVDWTSESLVEEQITERVNAFVFKPYDILGDLLFCKLVKVTDNRYLVVLASHHVIFDGIGLASLGFTLRDRYDQIAEGKQGVVWNDRFHEYVMYERNHVDSAETQRFWRDTLPDTLSAIEMSQTFNRVPGADVLASTPGATSGSTTKSLFVPTQHWDDLKKFIRKNKITPALYFKVLYGVLLQRYSQCETSFYIDEMIHGREKGFENVAGCFAQPSPFVFDASCFSDADGNPASILEIITNARAFQKSIKGKRLWSEQSQASLLPRSQHSFIFNFIPFVVAPDFLGEPTNIRELINHVSGTVEFTVVVKKEEVRCNLTYNAGEFQDFDFLERLVWLSEQIVGGNEALNTLDLVFEQEKTSILEQSGRCVDYDLSDTIPEIFERRVLECPKDIAVVCGDARLSYRALDHMVNELAFKLQEAGVTRNSLVALYADRSQYFLAAILAIMKNGAAYVPIDPKYPVDRIRYMLKDSQASVIVSAKTLVDNFSRSKGDSSSNNGNANSSAYDLQSKSIVYLDEVYSTTDIASDERESTGNQKSLSAFKSISTPNDLAYMIYTSGSTGEPKGALLHHKGALNHILAECDVLGFEGVFNFLQSAPSSSDISVWQFLGPVVRGGKTIILDDVTDIPALFDLLKTESIDLAELVPSVLQMLIDHVVNLDEKLRDLPCLKWMMATGEAVSVALVNRWLALYPNIPVVNAYGPTEASDDVIQAVISSPLKGDESTVPIGVPLPNLNILVLDHKGRLLPNGVVGEICIGGVGVGEGYWNKIEKTEEVFVSNRFEQIDSEKLYRTGDLGRWLANGNVEFIGRMDNQIQLRGFRVELGEIEAHLSSLNGVAEAVCVVRENQNLAAYLTLSVIDEKSDAALDAKSDNKFDNKLVREVLNSVLPDHMIPNSFTVLGKLPLTPAGKVDRKALPKPDEKRTDVVIEPRNSTEVALVDIWKDVLKTDAVSILDDFFTLGGHSLLGTRVVARIRDSLHVDLPMRTIFEFSTLSALALEIEKEKRKIGYGALPTIKPRQSVGYSLEAPVPLAYGQQRIWMMELLNPGSAAFNMPGAFNVRGELDLGVFESVMGGIVQRHETLRTHFTVDEQGEAFMVTGNPDDNWNLPVVDLRGFSNDEALLKVEIDTYLRGNEITPFDLLSGPLFRVMVLLLPDQDDQPHHTIMFCMHHIVSDGRSVEVLTQEIAKGYLDRLSGVSYSPNLPIQYADFALWQRTHLDSALIDKQLAYWENTLDGCASFLHLPTDFPRPAQQTTSGNRIQVAFPGEFSASLKAVSAEQGVTPFMFMLTAYQLLLSQYAEQDDVLVGIPMAGREQADLQDIIGFFINSVVIRGDMSDNKTIRSLLQNTREHVLDAFANYDVPAEKVLQVLDFERSPAFPPLVQVAFQLLQMPDQGVTDNAASSVGSSDTPFSLAFENLGLEKVDAKLDMTLELRMADNGVTAFLEYNTDLFTQDTITTFLENYIALAQSMMENIDSPSRSLEWLSEAKLMVALNLDPALVENVWPVTSMQRDLYLDSIRDLDSHKNSMGCVAELNSAIDPELMHVVINALSQSQSMLKSYFVESPFTYMDFVYQVIPKSVDVSFEYEDWTGNSLALDTLSDDGIQALGEQFVYRPFDVKRSRHLSRYRLVKLADKRFLFFMVGHHATTDGVAMNQFAKTIVTVYESLQQTPSLSVEDVVSQVPQDRFRDQIASDRQNMDRKDTLDFWRGALSNAESLVFRVNNFPVKSGAKVSKELVLDDAVWQSIKKYCRKNRITPAHYFKCIYGYLLKSYCGATQDFQVMELALGRTMESAETLGCFYQQIPYLMRQKVLGREMTMKDVFVDARSFQKEIKDYRNISGFAQATILPPGPVTFLYNYQAYYEEVTFNGQTLNNVGLPPDVEGHVLMSVKLADDKLHLILHYYDHLFEDLDFLERMVWITQQLLDGKEKLGDLSLVRPEEESQLISQAMSSTAERHTNEHKSGDSRPQEGEGYQPLVKQIEQTISDAKESVAVSCGDDSLTYAELDRKARSLALVLQRQGVGVGDVIGVCLNLDCDLMVALLAVLKTGAAYLPLDPKHPKERLLFMDDDSSAKFVLTDAGIQHNVMFPNALLHLEGYEAGISGSLANVSIEADALFYVIYTSGSTGMPKGALVDQNNVFNLQQWYCKQFAFDAAEQHLVVSAIGFDLTQKNLWAPLLTGGTLHFVDAHEYDPQIIVDTIKHCGITRVNCAPSAFYPLVDSCMEKGVLQALSTLKTVILGGEPIRMQALKPWLEHSDCECQVINTYGPTECTDIAAYYPIVEPQEFYTNPVPLGRSNDNVQLWVVDKHHHLLPQGLTGELAISGQGVGKGYLQQPDLTQAAFVPGVISNDVMYLTGDLVCQDKNGSLLYVGRNDFQVKVRGLRIELGEVEYALCQLKDVRDSLVLMRDDILVAYVLGDGAPDSLTQSDWRAALRNYLPEYMIPSRLFVLPQWPLNTNGKVDRQALPVDALEEAKYVAPISGVEKTLVDIWQRVLGVEKVGVTDDFFELGGHSILAVRLMSTIEREFNIQIPLASLFQMQTIAPLASFIEKQTYVGQSTEESWSHLVRLRSADVEAVDLETAGMNEKTLFCIHAVGGEVLAYSALARELSSNISVFGLQARGFVGSQSPLSDIGDMADVYVDHIKQASPSGPYYLCGQSMGGLIAIEIARRLQSDGSAVEAVFLLDTYIPSDKNKVDDVDFIVEKLGSIVNVDRETLNALSSEERIQFVVDSLISSGVLPAEISKEELETRVSVFLSHKQAFEQYKMQVYDGKLIHWCATQVVADGAIKDAAEGVTKDVLRQTAKASPKDKQQDTKQGTQPRAKSDTLWSSFSTTLDQRYINTDHEGVLQGSYAGEIAIVINKIIKN